MRRHLPGLGGLSMLSTLATLAVGCLIDGAIVALLAYMTDGRRGARRFHGTPHTGASRNPLGVETELLPRWPARPEINSRVSSSSWSTLHMTPRVAATVSSGSRSPFGTPKWWRNSS